jgi:hypothetical protein
MGMDMEFPVELRDNSVARKDFKELSPPPRFGHTYVVRFRRRIVESVFRLVDSANQGERCGGHGVFHRHLLDAEQDVVTSIQTGHNEFIYREFGASHVSPFIQLVAVLSLSG